MGCNCNGTSSNGNSGAEFRSTGVKAGASMVFIPKEENAHEFRAATYQGGDYNHMIISPTGIMRIKFNQPNYGRGKRGMQFLIHVNDIKARPDLFELVNDEDLSKLDKLTKDLPVKAKTEGGEKVTKSETDPEGNQDNPETVIESAVLPKQTAPKPQTRRTKPRKRG